MCRTELDIAKFHPNVVADLWKEIQLSFSEEIKERVIIQEKAIKDKHNLLKIHIEYGNTHEELKNFYISESGHENKHKWWAYVKLKDKLDESAFIKKVKFILDDTFEDSEIVRNFPPYEYIWRGWGEFEIPIHIYWQKWLNTDTTVINHSLKFNEDGSHKIFVLTIDKETFLKNYKESKQSLTVKRLFLNQKKRILY